MTHLRAGLFALLAVLAASARAEAADIETLVDDRAATMAQRQAGQLDALAALAGMPAIRDYFLASADQRPSRRRVLHSLLAGHSSAGELCLIDENGTEHLRVVHGHPVADGDLAANEADAPFFAGGIRLKAGESHVSPPYGSPDTHEWVLGYVVPVIPGKVILHLEQSLREVQRHAARDVSGADRVLLVVDRAGIIFGDSRQPVDLSTTGDAANPAANFHSIAAGPDRIDAAATAAMAAAPAGQVRTVWQGGAWDAAWRRVGPLTLLGLQRRR